MKNDKTLNKISNSKASSVNSSPKPQNFPEDPFAAVTYLKCACESSALGWCLAPCEQSRPYPLLAAEFLCLAPEGNAAAPAPRRW